MTNPLNLLSSLDGRYADLTAPLSGQVSEFAFLRDRVRVELDFLAALSKTGLTRPLTFSESAHLESIKSNFTIADAESIQAHERKTRHDVKAIEYFLQDKLQDTSLKDLLPWIHFGLTSEDVNNIAQVIALRDSRDNVLLPTLNALINSLIEFAKQTRALPMLARTHGQFAVPTILGKEFAVYIARLKTARDEISAHRFEVEVELLLVEAARPLEVTDVVVDSLETLDTDGAVLHGVASGCWSGIAFAKAGMARQCFSISTSLVRCV